MASARLIPKSLYLSKRFLELPVTAQNLMTYLILHSDNDGIVEAYAVMSMIKASSEDLRILDERGFVYVLNEDWVTYILQFQDFNRFDTRNFQVSKYRQLLVQVHPEVEEVLVTPKKRNRNKGIPRDDTGCHGESNHNLSLTNPKHNHKIDNLSIHLRERVNYNNLVSSLNQLEGEMLDDAIAIMMDVYTGISDTIIIGREEYPRDQVIARMDMVDESCIRYVIDAINNNSHPVRHPRAYMLTCLYNAPVTIDTHYITQINDERR